MKIIFVPLVLIAWLNSCHMQNSQTVHESKSNQKTLNQSQNSKMTQPCKKLLFAELIDQHAWNEVYEIFPTENNQPLSLQTLIGYIQDDLSVHDYAGNGNIGVPLGENTIHVKSEYATVTTEGENYLLDLKDDHLQYLIRQNFDEFSSVQYKSLYDIQFQDLCVDSHQIYIQTLKLVFSRSALNMYMYDVKRQGYL